MRERERKRERDKSCHEMANTAATTVQSLLSRQGIILPKRPRFSDRVIYDGGGDDFVEGRTKMDV